MLKDKVPHGWLLVYLFLQIIITLRILVSISSDINIIIYPEIWDIMIGELASHYSWLPAFSIMGMFNNIILFIWSIFSMIFLFTKKKYFIKVVIAFLGYYLLVTVFDYIITQNILIKIFPGSAEEKSDLVFFNLLESIVMTCIWVPYFLNSKKVKGFLYKGDISI